MNRRSFFRNLLVGALAVPAAVRAAAASKPPLTAIVTTPFKSGVAGGRGMGMLLTNWHQTKRRTAVYNPAFLEQLDWIMASPAERIAILKKRSRARLAALRAEPNPMLP